jgi:protein-S-isoprenylcysteine O-methyltransferase Ste14
MCLVGAVLFLAGIETRVRVEDKLLLGGFGARFEKWQSETRACLPFVR